MHSPPKLFTRRKENNHENPWTTRLRTRRATETAVPYWTTTKDLGRTLRNHPLVVGTRSNNPSTHSPHSPIPLLHPLSLYRPNSPTTPHTHVCRLWRNRPEYLPCRVPQSTAVRSNLTEDATMRYLSHNLWVVSDKTAGALARATPKPTLPKPGYEKLVILPDGRKAWLKRTTLTMLDSVKRVRGWVWTVHPL